MSHSSLQMRPLGFLPGPVIARDATHPLCALRILAKSRVISVYARLLPTSSVAPSHDSNGLVHKYDVRAKVSATGEWEADVH